MKKNVKKKGFTLVELIVVIAILGILAAIAVPKFTNVTSNAKIQADKANIATIEGAAQLYIAAQTGDTITAITDWSTTSDKDGLTDYLKTPLYQPGSTTKGYKVNISSAGKVTIENE